LPKGHEFYFFIQPFPEVATIMVERKIELRRRRTRGKKLAKLKTKLGNAKNPHEKDLILQKIKIVSPWWQEPQAAK
jgi:hypothetical protein